MSYQNWNWIWNNWKERNIIEYYRKKIIESVYNSHSIMFNLKDVFHWLHQIIKWSFSSELDRWCCTHDKVKECWGGSARITNMYPIHVYFRETTISNDLKDYLAIEFWHRMLSGSSCCIKAKSTTGWKKINVMRRFRFTWPKSMRNPQKYKLCQQHMNCTPKSFKYTSKARWLLPVLDRGCSAEKKACNAQRDVIVVSWDI